MPRTKAEKKRARARAIGCQRATTLPDRVAELEAESERARAQVAELRIELSASRAENRQNACRIAELEALLTLLQQHAPTPTPLRRAGGQEQLGKLQAGTVAMLPQPTPSTTTPRGIGIQQPGDSNALTSQRSIAATPQQHNSTELWQASYHKYAKDYPYLFQ